MLLYQSTRKAFLATLLSLCLTPSSASALEVKVYVSGFENGTTGLLANAQVCGAFVELGKTTSFEAANSANTFNSLKTVYTDSSGFHRFDLGHFESFDGRIRFSAVKAGFCPTVCEVWTKFDRNISDRRARQPGNYTAQEPPQSISCGVHLRRLDGLECGATAPDGSPQINSLSSQEFSGSNPYTRHSVSTYNGKHLGSACAEPKVSPKLMQALDPLPEPRQIDAQPAIKAPTTQPGPRDRSRRR